MQTDFNYRLFRYASANPDDLSTSSANSETGNQGLGGMVYNMAQLGISNGTLVYGYSLFGYDVGTNGSDPLVLSTYSSTTDSSTGGGGVDLAGVNGLAFVLVPEPSTYALGGVGVMAALAVLHRHRQRKLRNPDGKGTAA